MKRILIIFSLILSSLLCHSSELNFGYEEDESTTKLDNSEICSSEIFESFQYFSDTFHSAFGESKTNRFDAVADNIHIISIDSLPTNEFKAFVNYEMIGLGSHVSIARSINQSISLGGQVMISSEKWECIREEINPHLLRKGSNSIYFSLEEGWQDEVQIRKVSIELVYCNKSSAVVIPQSNIIQTQQGIYLKGFVSHNSIASISIDNINLDINDGQFEGLIESSDSILTVQYIFNDGAKKEISIPIERLGQNNLEAVVIKKQSSRGYPAMPSGMVCRENIEFVPFSDSEASYTIYPLRKIDSYVADAEFTNITKEAQGYRIKNLNDSSSPKGILSFKIDPSKIPQGYTINDVKIEAFDVENKKWIVLNAIVLDEKSMTIAVETGEYNDFMGGIIQVPESPQTNGFTPTHISDFKAGDASSGIVNISPPTPSNSGAMTTSFPIKLPTGRQRMQPQISLSYNNQSGNGAVGIGWSLPYSAIGIETRWGVPRYNPDENSETYTLDGQMLNNVAHRSDNLTSRQANTTYRKRVEGSFQKIERKGNKPWNHYWIVTEKDGTKKYYGGINSVDNSAVLRTGSGSQANISQWNLVRVENANGQYMEYSYETIVHDQSPGQGGKQIYLSEIRYTGQGSNQGKYKVSFNYTDSYNGNLRPDPIIYCKLGFVQVTAHLLDEIEVYFQSELIRSYQLEYEQGAFFKTLLSSVAEFNGDGDEFYKHRFTYYDDVREGSDYSPYSAPTTYDLPNDEVNGNLLTLPVSGWDGYNESSALGGGKSNSTGFNAAITIGALGGKFNKTNTFGGNFSMSNSTSEGLLSLIDVNGDNLPDKLIRKTVNNGVELYYRPNISSEDNISFGQPIPINGAPGDYFSKTKIKNRNKGLEGHPAGVFVGKTWSETNSTTTNYLMDRNSDGLVDIVANGIVRFGKINPNGDINLNVSSQDTDNPIPSGQIVDTTLYELPEDYYETIIEENPLHDLVRVWVAPYSGSINILGDITLLEDLSEAADEYESEDGVVVSIQIGDDAEHILITPEQAGSALTFPNGFTQNQNVQKGERIYFRVNSFFDGSFDRVIWNPVITYTDTDFPNFSDDPVLIDANGKSLVEFNAKDDFSIHTDQSLIVPYSGEMNILGVLDKGVLTDDIKVIITRQDTAENSIPDTLVETLINWDEVFNSSLSNASGISVSTGDEIKIRIESSTNLDWKAIEFNPTIQLIANEDTSFYEPVVSHTMYNHVFARRTNFLLENRTNSPSRALTVFDSGNLTIAPDFNQSLIPNFAGPESAGKVTFSIKKPDGLVGKIEMEYDGISEWTNSDAEAISFQYNESDSVYIEYHISNRNLADSIKFFFADVTVNSGMESTTDLSEKINDRIGVHTIPGFEPPNFFTGFAYVYEPVFGPLYRNWGQFIYRGNDIGEPSNFNGIDENDLWLESFGNSGDAEIGGDLPSDPDALDESTSYNPASSKAIVMFADGASRSWRGLDNLSYLNLDTISSSRLGEDDLSFLTFDEHSSELTYAPNKRNKSDGTSESVGFFISYGGSDGSSQIEVDTRDFNGDGYDDFFSKDKIQYTTMTGGLMPESMNLEFEENTLHEASSSVEGYSIAGSTLVSTFKNAAYSNAISRIAKSKGISRSKVKADIADAQNTSNSDAQAKDSKVKIGLPSANINTTNDHVVVTWMDMNGDGLPDKVTEEGNVSLNLGYSFTQFEQWDFSDIKKGKSDDTSLGLGVSLFNGAISAGTSMSIGNNYSTHGFLDVNSDGLTDVILTEDDLISQVRMNTGNGFSNPVDWPGLQKFDEGYSAGQSINGTGTYCQNFVFFRLCFTAGANAGLGMSKPKSQFIDIDGDGYQDYVRSNDESEMTVVKSKLGRTNQLKTVTGPFNASFTVDYDKSEPSYDYPNSKWVLSEVTVFDGYQGDGSDLSYSTFDYKNGKYDRRERSDYGFGQVVTTNFLEENGDFVPYRQSISEYDVKGYYTSGLLLRSTLVDADSALFTQVENTYSLKGEDGVDLSDDFNSTNDDSWAFPALQSSIERFYEGQDTPLERTIEFEYDEIGNVILFKDYGDGSDADYVEMEISYHQGLSDDYIMNIPQEALTNDATGEVRKRNQEVDNNGNVTAIKQYFSNSEFTKTDFEYFTSGIKKGQLKKVTRPENGNGDRLWFTYDYDTEVASYITKVEDVYGYESEQTFEYQFGTLQSETDINGNVTTYETDQYGRVTAVTGPYEQGTSYKTISIDYQPDAAIPYAVVGHFNPEFPDDPIETITFLDGFFRPVQIKKTAVVDGQDAYTVSGPVVYDALGRTIELFFPIAETSANPYLLSTSNEFAIQNSTAFDVLDRSIETELADGATSQVEFSISADHSGDSRLRQKSIDFKDKVSETYTDQKGRTLSQARLLDGSRIWTRFNFNAISELVSVLDHEDNETSYTYDKLGRKLTYTHPDAGTTTYVYDNVGNITRKITSCLAENIPQDGHITYKYDHERLVQIDYPVNYQNRVEFKYGAPDAPFNRAGRIELQIDPSGGQEFYYGPLGEIEKTMRTIVVSQNNIHTYISEAKYDTWNRIQEMAYPDGEIVYYDYDKGGNLQKMYSEKGIHTYPIIDDMRYDEFGQRISMTYGNGTSTSYNYDPLRRRLTELTASAASGSEFMNFSYSYDDMNNIVSLSNTANPSGSLGGTFEQNYDYDDLHRLTSSIGSHNSGSEQRDFTLNMEYDALYNITQKTKQVQSNTDDEYAENASYDQSYNYGSQVPHQPDSIGDYTYEYDENGNLISRNLATQQPSFRNLIWDEENRLQYISDEGYVSKHTYDASGERIIKSHGGLTGIFVNGYTIGHINHEENYTIYVSPYLVVADSGFSKHYYAGAQRVLSKVGVGQFNQQGPFNEDGVYAGNVNYGAGIASIESGAQEFFGEQGQPPGQPTIENYYTHPLISGLGVVLPDLGGFTPLPSGFVDIVVSNPEPGETPGQPTTNVISVNRDSLQAGFLFEANSIDPENNQYFFHTDHLGSSSYISNATGDVRQYIAYIPFGETLFDQHITDTRTPYLYTGKERDVVTGLDYFGARYYDSGTSIWLSVDPMAEKYVGLSPYSYALQNPIILLDPDGNAVLAAAAVVLMAAQVFSTSYSATSELMENGPQAAAESLAIDAAFSFVGAKAFKMAGKFIGKNKYVRNTVESTIKNTIGQISEMAQGKQEEFSFKELGSDMVLDWVFSEKFKIDKKLNKQLDRTLDKVQKGLQNTQYTYLKGKYPNVNSSKIHNASKEMSRGIIDTSKKLIAPKIENVTKDFVQKKADDIIVK